jgi:hypothetical protein
MWSNTAVLNLFINWAKVWVKRSWRANFFLQNIVVGKKSPEPKQLFSTQPQIIVYLL